MRAPIVISHRSEIFASAHAANVNALTLSLPVMPGSR